jgi:hypothetical protein
MILTAAKFKPLTISLYGFALFYAGNILIFLILNDVCFLPALLCSKVTYVWNFESHIQFPGRCAPWNVTNGEDKLVLQALQFQKRCLPRTPRPASDSH